MATEPGGHMKQRAASSLVLAHPAGQTLHLEFSAGGSGQPAHDAHFVAAAVEGGQRAQQCWRSAAQE
jgi:hypothetical protein